MPAHAVADRTSKICGRCKTDKPLDQFSRRTMNGGKIGVHSYCKPCNVESNRLWRFGLTQEQYDEMVEKQSGLCAICRKPPEGAPPRTSVLHIDHDHATGRVRALLCSRCNNGLGCFGDDIEALLSAVAYLQHHGGQ